LFADDVKIFKEIKTIKSEGSLEEDLRALEYWTKENHSPLSVMKCKAMISPEKKCNQYTPKRTWFRNGKQPEVQKAIPRNRNYNQKIEHNLSNSP